MTLVATIAALQVGQAMAAHSSHQPASRMPPASQAAPPTATPAFGPAPAQGYYQPPMTIPQEASPYVFTPAPAQGFYHPPMNVEPN
jgi:hypothetical protein